jgi:hypothetical protein
MDGLNKLIIMLLLLGILYALWRHQQFILGNKKTHKKKHKKIRNDEILSDSDVSKVSVSSSDEKKFQKSGYKPESVDNESLNSYGNLSFLDDSNDNGDFFFQKKQN